MKARFWVVSFLVLPLAALLGMGGQSIPMGALPRTLATWPQTDSITNIASRWYLCGDSTGATCTASSSTSAYDSSGNANTGTWSGTQSGSTNWYDTGVNLPSVGHFNGSDNYILGASGISTSDATVTAWVYISSVPAANACVVSLSTANGSGTADKTIYIDSAGKPAWLTYNGSWQIVQSSSSIPLNTWTFLAGSIDSAAGSKIWVNGSVTGSSGAVTVSYTGSMKVLAGGALTNGSSCTYLPMKLSDARVYTRALTSGELATIYAEANH